MSAVKVQLILALDKCRNLVRQLMAIEDVNIIALEFIRPNQLLFYECIEAYIIILHNLWWL